MENREINLVYVDDNIDSLLTDYLYDYDYGDNVNINYEELSIKNQNQKEIMELKVIQEANIIIIDSRLYENNNRDESSLSGEALKLLLMFNKPYDSVLVISQNDEVEEFENATKKFVSDKRPNVFQEAKKYYDNKLSSKIQSSIRTILDFRKIYKDKITSNATFSENLEISKISDSLNGNVSYVGLTDKKIDELIDLVKRLENE